VLYDRLDATLKTQLADLARNPDFYGVALDRITGSTKSLDRDSALLLHTMRAPGVLPHYALRLLGASATRTITGYVLDRVLEIEVDGRFVSGSAAVDVLAPSVDADGIDTLSMAALRAVAALPIDDTVALARRLYGYNRLPRTPRHRWTESGGEAWITWSGPGYAAPPERIFKLYVSPVVNDVPAAVDAAKAVTGPHGGKLGAGPYGLLRPDKLVLYYASFDALYNAASRLMSALDGVRPHGVPFTAPLAGEGLLSWGIDPPVGSWRSWITDRLAAAMIVARVDRVDPVSFALRRIAALGVDPRTWTQAA
jgi:hypothetical protein